MPVALATMLIAPGGAGAVVAGVVEVDHLAICDEPHEAGGLTDRLRRVHVTAEDGGSVISRGRTVVR